MPWHRPETWDRRTFGYYQALVALRHRTPALRHGGLRWLHAEADTLVFARETSAEAVLVLARRAEGKPLRLRWPAAANLYGGAADLARTPTAW